MKTSLLKFFTLIFLTTTLGSGCSETSGTSQNNNLGKKSDSPSVEAEKVVPGNDNPVSPPVEPTMRKQSDLRFAFIKPGRYRFTISQLITNNPYQDKKFSICVEPPPSTPQLNRCKEKIQKGDSWECEVIEGQSITVWKPGAGGVEVMILNRGDDWNGNNCIWQEMNGAEISLQVKVIVEKI